MLPFYTAATFFLKTGLQFAQKKAPGKLISKSKIAAAARLLVLSAARVSVLSALMLWRATRWP